MFLLAQVSRTRRTQLTAAAVGFVVFAVVVEQILVDGALVDVDRRVFDHFFYRRRTGDLVTLSRAVTPFGDAFLVTAAIAVGTWVLLRHQRRRDATFLVTAGIGGIVLNTAMRILIGHIRPGMPRPYALITRFCLPSGHAFDATVLYGALLVIAWSRLSTSARVVATAATCGLVVAVACSRFVLVAHFLSDVIAGIALGVAWLLVVAAAFSLPSRDERRLPQAA